MCAIKILTVWLLNCTQNKNLQKLLSYGHTHTLSHIYTSSYSNMGGGGLLALNAKFASTQVRASTRVLHVQYV